MTTELGVLDIASRISTDIVKVNWLRGRANWTERRLYFLFLWGTIAMGTGVLLLKTAGWDIGVLTFFKLTAAMNGAVMFLYSGILIYLNTRALPPAIRISRPRLLAMSWAVLFFGFFAVWAGAAVLKNIMDR